MKNVIFDLYLTLVDTTILEQARHDRNWSLAYTLIPRCHVYYGLGDVFDFIRKNNVNTCIVSTSPRPYVERIVSHFNLPIKHIVSYHDAKPIKPHPAQMLKALELMCCPARNAISFGDRLIDIQASNAANIESVSCLWGTKERSNLLLSNYNHVISNPTDIISLFLNKIHKVTRRRQGIRGARWGGCLIYNIL